MNTSSTDASSQLKENYGCFLSDHLTARVSDLSDVILVTSPCSQISDINLLSNMLLLLIEMMDKYMKINQNYVLVQQTGSDRVNATQQL